MKMKLNAAMQVVVPQNLLDEVTALLSEQKRLEKSLKTTEYNLTKSETDLAKARLDLAKVEHQRLLEIEDAPDVELDHRENMDSPEAETFVQCTLARQKALAAREFCFKCIQNKDLDLLSVAEKLKKFRNRYNDTAWKQFLEQEFQPAAAVFTATLRKGLALEEALGGGDAYILHHQLPTPGSWKEDEEALRIYKQHSAPRELQESINKFLEDAQRRMFLLKRNKRHMVGFDPQGKYEIVREFSYDGQEFTQGATVDYHVIDLRTLSLLYMSKRLRLLGEREADTTLADQHIDVQDPPKKKRKASK